MTTIMITAILSLLLAFGVDTPTVNNVRAILTKTEATTTPVTTVQTITTPIVENQPVYFGSIVPTPVVESPVMEEATKELVVSIPSTISGQPSEVIEIHYKENGKEIAGVPITITLSQGTFLITGQVGRDPGAGTRVNTVTIPNGEHGTLKGYSTTGIKYSSYSDVVGTWYPGATITVSANGITKTIQGRDIYKINE